MIKNAAPPLLAAWVGKPQMLPRPTAEPAAARIKPNLDRNSPLGEAKRCPLLNCLCSRCYRKRLWRVCRKSRCEGGWFGALDFCFAWYPARPLHPYSCPGGEIGRHRGLKIPRPLRSCRFKSGPGHHVNINTNIYLYVLRSPGHRLRLLQKNRRVVDYLSGFCIRLLSRSPLMFPALRD